MDILVYVVEGYGTAIDGARYHFPPAAFLSMESAQEYKRELILAGASHAVVYTAIEHI